MKKMLSALAALICFLGLAVSAYAETPAEKELTLMIYMCGSNLQSQNNCAAVDMGEMENSGMDPDEVNLLVLTGGANMKDWTALSVNYLEPFTVEGETYRDFQSQHAENFGSNMGDASTLSNYIRYCIEQYPAKQYALILWDHGEGPLGHICHDECNGNDGLSIAELAEALKNAELPQKLSWIGFDACLMSTAEVALAVSPYAEYMIASQETEPADGWNYTFLKGIENDADGAETGKRIVDAYFSGRNASQYGITLSCTDLGAISGLTGAMNRFFGPITDKLDSHTFASLSELRTASANFGRAVRSVSKNGYDLVDLLDLVKHYQTLGDIVELEDVVNNAVIYSRANLEGANGLSVYHALYNKEDYLTKWHDLYSSLPFSKGYQSYLSLFGSILTGGALTDWADIRLEDDGFSPLLENLFHIRLTPEQRESIVSAQLIVLGSLSGKDASSPYEMQLLTNENNPNQKTIYYYPVWNADVDHKNGAELDFCYGGQSIYVTDENGKALAGPVSYSLSEDGTEWYIHVNYQDHSGKQKNAPDADVLYTCTLDDASGRLSIIKTEVYDSATQTYTRRLAFSEDDYTRMQIDRCAKALPHREGALPGFEAWNDQSLYLELSLPLKWNLQVIGKQLSGTPLYATVQITDTQQNNWCTPLIRLQNPNLYDIDISPRTISGDGYEATLYAVMDNSELTPGLSISIEVTNTTNIDTSFKVDGFILNGKRSAFGEDSYSSFYISAKAGESGYDACHISADQLWDLDEIREISFTMEAQNFISREPLHIEYDEIPVDLAISSCEIAAFENKSAHPLSAAETDGVRWELVSLSPSIQGGLDAIVHIENGCAKELVYTAASLGINGVLQISYGNDLSIRVFPATDAYLNFRIRDYVEFEKASLHIQGRTSRTYLGDYQLLEQFGITEIDKLQLFYSINDNACPVMFELDQPIAVGTSDAWAGTPMEDRFAAAMKYAPLLTGDVSVAVDQILVADNGIGIRYLIRNHNDQDIILNIGNPKIDDRESYTFETVFNLGAHTTMLAMQEVSFSDYISKGHQLSDIGITFRYDGYTTARAHIRLPEVTHLGIEDGLYLSSPELITEPSWHPQLGIGIVPVRDSSDYSSVELAIMIENEKDDFLAPDDYWDNPTKLKLCFTVHSHAEEMIRSEFIDLTLNNRRVEAYCNQAYGSNTYTFDIDQIYLTNMEELHSVSCVLTETPGYKRDQSRKTTLRWELDGFSLKGLSPTVEKAIGSAEADGLQVQVLSLRTYPSNWNDYGKLDFLIVCKNEGDTEIDLMRTLLAIDGINPQDLGHNFNGTRSLPPDTEQLFKLTYTNTADMDYSLFKINDSQFYRLPFEGSVLQCTGLDTIREISLLFPDGATESVYKTVTVPIDAFKLPEAENADLAAYAEAKSIIDGDVSVKAAYFLVGDEEIGVTLIANNDSNYTRTLQLSSAEAGGNALRFGWDETKTMKLLPHTTQVKTVALAFSEKEDRDEALRDFKLSFSLDGESVRDCILRSGYPLFLGSGVQVGPAHIQVLTPEDAQAPDASYICSIGIVIYDTWHDTFREISSAPYEEDLNYNEIFAPAVLITDYAPDMPSPSVYLEVNGQPTYFDKFDIGQYSYFWYYCTSAYSGPGSYECVAYIDGVKCCSQTIEVRTVRTRAPTALESAHTGDMVLFGAYEQDGDPNNGPERIEWLVLDEHDGKRLLVSRYALAREQMIEKAGTYHWEDSSLRIWLNQMFYETAFNESERKQILLSTIENKSCENSPFGNTGGTFITTLMDLNQRKDDPDTQDHVFLLSYEELVSFFPEEGSRRCRTSALFGSEACEWWLRSPDLKNSAVITVAVTGNTKVNSGIGAVFVRPALWITG